MPRDLNKGLLKYIKGPSYFKHFLIGAFGGDSARARLSGASRYIYIIATGYESNTESLNESRLLKLFEDPKLLCLCNIKV